MESFNFGKHLEEETYTKKRVLVYTRDNFTPKPAVVTLVKTVYLYPSGSLNQREKTFFLAERWEHTHTKKMRKHFFSYALGNSVAPVGILNRKP